MNRRFYSTMLVLLLVAASPSMTFAQSKLYFDTRIGAGYNFVEGAHAGKGERPFKARNFLLHTFLYLQPRLQFNEQWALTAGYRGSGLTRGYKIEVPADVTVNPFPQGNQSGLARSAYLHQLPVQLHYTLGRYNIHPLDTLDRLYLLSFKLDVFVGGGLNRVGNNCLDCGNYDTTPLTGGTSPVRDVIEFREQPYYNRTWGGFLTGGVTAHFYRLGKERLNFSLALTQGLTDMMVVPVQYSYNGHLGATTLHVRGSGISATLGYPILISTFVRR
ncbi:hypothetical protein [Hymenobacter algoricola]